MCGVKKLLRQYLHYIRDLKQITTVTYTMSAGHIIKPKNDAVLMLGIDLSS